MSVYLTLQFTNLSSCIQALYVRDSLMFQYSEQLTKMSIFTYLYDIDYQIFMQTIRNLTQVNCGKFYIIDTIP